MHDDLTEINPYLRQEVLSASPLRLRWMLIQRAEEWCATVLRMWSSEQGSDAGQWILRIRDILGELLDGVQDADNPVSQPVSDFYVFLLQLLSEAEQTQNVDRLTTLRELLAIEAETWRQVVEKMGSDSEPLTAMPGHEVSLGESRASQVQPAMPPISHTLATELGGGFSLEV